MQLSLMDDTPITVRLIDRAGNSLPIANILVDLRFYVEGRYRYGFGLGRTKTDGVLRTTLGDIQNQLDENRRSFLMDYNTPLSDCDDLVGIYAPTPDELTEREISRSKWWPGDEPLPAAANDLLRCEEQRFTLRTSTSNEFALVCHRV